MPQQKQPLPKSAPSQNLRWQKPNPVHHANLAIQMLAAAPNHRALKYAEQSAVMMFGILPANRSARVAKNQQVLAQLVIVMKMTVQLAHHASTTTTHRLAHRAPAAMMRRQVVVVVMMHQ
jgi:hypothetical protein